MYAASDERELSGNELAAVSFLRYAESASASEIAEAIGLTRRGTSKLLARLIERDLVERAGLGMLLSSK